MLLENAFLKKLPTKLLLEQLIERAIFGREYDIKLMLNVEHEIKHQGKTYQLIIKEKPCCK